MKLVGREPEVEALRNALEHAQLVTVWGPVGVGKSRLVREALEAPCWCALTPTRDPAAIERAVARALGIASVIPRALARRKQPLVLEGADESALRELLPRWLRASDELRMVVTAPSALGIEGEHALELGPLSVEDALVVWLDATHRLGHESDPQLGREIVARLDRLPLALEWFAAQAAFYGDAACLERIRRFGEGEDPLSEALDHTLQALTEDERETLARIATFEEGAPAAGLEFDCIDRLARRALVRTERAGTAAPRVTAYRAVIKRMRQRAREEGQWDRLTRLHAEAALALAQNTDLLALAAERAELEAISERFSEADPELALRACVAMCPLSHHDGTAAATAERLTRLCARVKPPPEAALLALGGLERRLGHFQTAREHLSAAAGFHALIELAHLDRMQSRLEAALAGYQRALALATERDNAEERCIGLGEVGRMLQSMGRFREAQDRHEQAIALSRSLGLLDREALERSLHARATHRAGDVREAIPLHDQALALHRRLGDRRLAGAELGHLGFCHHEIGKLRDAETLFRQSIDSLADVGDLALECIERTLLARLLCDEERFAEAKLELAIVETLTRDLDMPRIELSRRFVAGLIDLGQNSLASARNEWRSAHALGIHPEVGFEALLPAHLALANSLAGDRGAVEDLLAQSSELVTRLETPGLHAALAILSAAACGTPVPEISATVVASSSDTRRALRLIERAGVIGTLQIAADGRSLTLAHGATVKFGRRAAPRRVLLALTRARLERPGGVLTFDELIAAGWPGERMHPDAARKRLRTVIWTLRKLGLEPFLLTRDDGYLLDPFLPIRLIEKT